VISYIVIAALAIILVGLIVLEHAIKSAPFGYEDGDGFHEGSDPQRAMTFGADLRTAAAKPLARAPREGLRAQRLFGRTLRKSVGHSS
jgi:hypothetical protein